MFFTSTINLIIHLQLVLQTIVLFLIYQHAFLNSPVRSSDDPVSSFVFSLDAVLVGIAILILTNLILSVELIGRGCNWRRDSNRLTYKIRLSNNRLVHDVLLRIDGNVSLRLAIDDLLGHWRSGKVDLRLGNNLWDDRDRSCVDLRFNSILLGNSDLWSGCDQYFWLSNVRLNFHWGDLRLFLHWRLVGNCFSDKSQVLFSGSNNFG